MRSHSDKAACAWALEASPDLAFRNLKKALDAGWTDLERMEGDASLEGLRQHKTWKELLSRLGPRSTGDLESA